MLDTLPHRAARLSARAAGAATAQRRGARRYSWFAAHTQGTFLGPSASLMQNSYSFARLTNLGRLFGSFGSTSGISSGAAPAEDLRSEQLAHVQARGPARAVHARVQAACVTMSLGSHDVTFVNVNKVRSARMGENETVLARAMQARPSTFALLCLSKHISCAGRGVSHVRRRSRQCLRGRAQPGPARRVRSAVRGQVLSGQQALSSPAGFILALRMPAKLGRPCVRPTNAMTCTADGSLLYRSTVSISFFDQ